MRRYTGVGRNEILAFIVVMGLGAMIALYLFQKPKVVEHTVVIAPPPPAPVVEATPPPVPVETPAPPPVVAKPIVVVKVAAAPPAPPACVAFQAKLKEANIAIAKAQFALEAAKTEAVNNVRKSDDYQNENADLADKKKARDDALAQLAADNTAGADTDHDNEIVRSTATDLMAAKAKLVALETEATANDQNVTDKQAALKAAMGGVGKLREQLNAYIVKTISSGCAIDKCHIDLAQIDPKDSTIYVQLTPGSQSNAGATTDAAISAVGQIMEKILRKSALDWDSVKFTVYADFQKKRVPEFQLTYLRSAVDAGDFKKIDQYYDNQALVALAQTIWLSSAANAIQGTPVPPPVMQGSSTPGGRTQLKYTESLLIGGYARADGSKCPTSYINQSYYEQVVPGLQARTPSRSLYIDTSPMILSGHP